MSFSRVHSIKQRFAWLTQAVAGAVILQYCDAMSEATADITEEYV